MYKKQICKQNENSIVTAEVNAIVTTDTVESNTITPDPVMESKVPLTDTTDSAPGKPKLDPLEPLKEQPEPKIPRPEVLISSGIMAKQLGFSEDKFYSWLVKHDVLKRCNGKYLLNKDVASGFFATNIFYTFRHPDGEFDQDQMLMWSSSGVDFLSALSNLDKKKGELNERTTN